jgi:hypothetical protein
MEIDLWGSEGSEGWNAATDRGPWAESGYGYWLFPGMHHCGPRPPSASNLHLERCLALTLA